MYIVVAAFGLMSLLKTRETYNAVFAAFLILVCSVKGEALPLIAAHPEAPLRGHRVSLRRVPLHESRPRPNQHPVGPLLRGVHSYGGIRGFPTSA